jgi:CheY-like chemotaxis protein
MPTKSGRIFEILVVEDNPGDVRLLQETLRDSPHEIRFTVAEDGEVAMDILHRDEDSLTPDLILLDLNLPKKDGREVLSEIMNDPALSRIPVVVLTSSQADKDRMYSEQHHADGYFNKPINASAMNKLVQALTVY